jgi:hypothetical protein
MSSCKNSKYSSYEPMYTTFLATNFILRVRRIQQDSEIRKQKTFAALEHV